VVPVWGCAVGAPLPDPLDRVLAGRQLLVVPRHRRQPPVGGPRLLLAAAELAVADQPAPLVVVGRDEVAGLVVAETGTPGLAVTVVRRNQGPPAVVAAPGVPVDRARVECA